MKTDIRYDSGTNLITQVLHGDCSIRNLARLFDEMEHFQLRPDLKIFTDITDADLSEVNYAGLSILEHRLDEFLEKYLPVKKAILVESELEFGIARMYQMLSEREHFDVEVFRSKKEAMQWLGI